MPIQPGRIIRKYQLIMVQLSVGTICFLKKAAITESSYSRIMDIMHEMS